MNTLLQRILIANGFEQTFELQTATGYATPDDKVQIAVQAGRILINGDHEHTIDTSGLDEYDIAFVLHALKVVDLGLCAEREIGKKAKVIDLPGDNDITIPKKNLTSGLAGAYRGNAGYDYAQKQQLQLNAMTA